MSEGPRDTDTTQPTEARDYGSDHGSAASTAPDSEASSTKETDANPAPPRRRRWPRRLAVTAVVLLAIYTIVGVLVVPMVVQRAIVPRVAERLTGDVTLEEVSCNPFTLGLELRGLTVTEASGEPALEVARIAGNFDLIETLFNDGFWFNHLRVFDPVVRAEIDERGRINLIALLGELPEPEEEEPGEPPRVVIGDVAIESATIRLRDRTTTPTFERTLTGLTLRCDRVDTAPTHDNSLNMTATLGQSTSVRWSGEAALDPLDKTGTLRVEGLQLDAFSPYAETFAGLSIDSGEVDVELRYAIDLPTDTGGVAIERSRLTARDLRITAGEQPILQLAEADLTGIAASLFDGTASVERVAVRGLEVDARREADGQFEVVRRYLEAIRTAPFHGNSTANTSATATSTSAPPPGQAMTMAERHPVEMLVLAVYQAFADRELDWQLRMGDMEVRESAVRWSDRAAAEPVDVALTDITADIGTLTNDADTSTPVQLSATSSAGGRLEAGGEVAPVDRTAALDVELAGWPLAPLRGYLPAELPEPFDGTRLVSAFADAKGTFRGSRGEEGFDAAWNGRVAMKEFATQRPEAEPPLAFEAFAAAGKLEVAGQALGRQLEDVTLDATWDGTLSLSGFHANVAMPDTAGRLAFDSLRVEGGAQAAYANEALRATWNGSVSLSDMLTSASAPLEGSATAGDVAISGGSVTWDGGKPVFDIASIDVKQPMLQLVLPMLTASPAVRVETQQQPQEGESESDRVTVKQAENGATDDATAGGGDAAADASPVEQLRAALDALPFELRLGVLNIDAAGFEVKDQAENAALTLTGREGEVTLESIDTAGGTPMRLAASAAVLDAGRVELTGEANPFAEAMSVDLAATVRDLPLRPLSAAIEPQLGYTVDRGRLSVDLPVRVEGTDLSGKIDARLQGFYLGDKVDSPAAPNLPLKLGLDLLRDRDDVVSLNIGLTGDVSDPTFNVGKLVWGAIFKAMSSVVSSPFRLIASAVGGSDELDLSRARFLPGTTEFAEGEARKIDTLADGLQQRPRLNLLVIGATGSEDAKALREQRLDDEISAHADDEALPPDRALRDLFEKAFPDATRQRVPVPPGRLDQATIAPDAMRARLLENVTLPDGALAELATARAERIVRMLTEAEIDPARLSTAGGDDTQAGAKREAAPAATFELLSRSRAE